MAARFWVGGTGTWDASDTSHWSASSGGASGASVPTTSDTVTFDGSSGGGTVTVNGNFTNNGLAMGAFTGTLDFSANNNNMTCSGSFNISGSGTRTLNMGSGTFTLSGANSTVWDATTITGLTFNCGTSTILLQTTATATRTLALNTLTYNTITFNNTGGAGFQISFTGNSTIANLNLGNCRNVNMPAGPVTITGQLTNANVSGSPGLFGGSNAANDIELSLANANTVDWLALWNIVVTGAGSLTANSSFNLGGLTNVTVNQPRSAYVIGG